MYLTLNQANTIASTGSKSLWNISNQRLAVLVEQTHVELELPLNSEVDSKIEKIGGSLPDGLRLEDKKITGVLTDIAYDTKSTFVIRATSDTRIEDRTFEIVVTNPDSPEWITPSGQIEGASPHNQNFFVLSHDLVDFYLEAEVQGPVQSDLEFYLKSGQLPPGLTMSADGRIKGITAGLQADPAQDPDFYCDSMSDIVQRSFEFTVTVTDGIASVDRDFSIFVVNNEFITANADCYIKVGENTFAVNQHDNTVPVWLTPGDLGTKRANNFATTRVEVIDAPGLPGDIAYTLEPVNPDCSPSMLPGNMCLDRNNGYIHGFLPYQNAIEIDHEFTITATRVLDNTINVKETIVLAKDAFANTNCLNTENINDDIAEYLIDRRLNINGKCLSIISADNDQLCFDDLLKSKYPLAVAREVQPGNSRVIVNRLDTRRRELYTGNTVEYNNEYLHIDTITPVIEYRIRKTGLLDGIYPWTLQEYYEIDYADFGYVVFDLDEYKKSIKTINDYTAGLIDTQEDYYEALYAVYGYTAFDTSEDIPPSMRDLEDEIDLVIDALNEACPDSVLEYQKINRNNYLIRLVSNQCTRTKSKVKQTVEAVNQFYEWRVNMISDDIDYVDLSNTATDYIPVGTDLGFVLFAGDTIDFDFYVSDDPVIDSLQSSKTFSLSTVGEIDSFISWETDPDLGSINPWTDSILKLEATTTVENSMVVYTVVEGSLPPGMWLASTGEIIGQAEINDSSEKSQYSFVVEARDRFRFAAKRREFTLSVVVEDDVLYTDVYFRPLLKPSDREYYRSLVSSPEIFDPSSVYRPADPAFGIQQSLDMLLFAGIESTELAEYAHAVAKNHSRKNYILGEFKTAFAKTSALADTEYEVIYIEVIDPNDQGMHLSKPVKNARPWSGPGYPPMYLTKISNMRYRVAEVGKRERNYLPLWMRTAQGGFQELDYQPAIPVCYCKPGTSEQILEKIRQSGFKANNIHYDIDRYVVKRASNYTSEQYIVFGDYDYNI